MGCLDPCALLSDAVGATRRARIYKGNLLLHLSICALDISGASKNVLISEKRE